LTQLISEPLQPVIGQTSGAVIAGAPLLPAKFLWRGVEYEIREIFETWKETGPCTQGSGERYLRKHWFRIRATGGDEMKIYFERKPRPRQAKQRWWLYTFTPADE